MFFRMIYDDKLAQAAYLIGCQQTGEALLIDPERDVDRYVTIARQNGLRIVSVAETHIHADFLSGARELAETQGARLHLSDMGDRDWKYEWLGRKRSGGSYDCQLLRDGDAFRVGRIEITAIHTPGHTPEHLCFLVTDHGAGATEPMGVATGDFLFVGDLGRPDLLETAAGQAGAMQPAARKLFESVRKLAEWPDFLQVWPGHGAGSACGKALGAVPQSTVGYEKRFNAAVRASRDESGFVEFILGGQPEPPVYFARMKHVNKTGPSVLGGLPRPKTVSAAELRGLATQEITLIDTRCWLDFRQGHVPGALYIPLDRMFPTVAGSFVEPGRPIYIVAEEGRVEEAVRDLVRIGLDDVCGFVPPDVFREYAERGGTLTTASEVDVGAVRERVGAGAGGGGAAAQEATATPFLLDVRNASEFAAGHAPGAHNVAYTRLAARLDEIPRDRPVLVSCRSGGRSARASAFLRRAGIDATNVAGGMDAWMEAGLPVER